MKKIALTGKYGKGKFAFVSDEDFSFLSTFKWVLHVKGYAVSTEKTIRMHRILFSTIPKDQDVDHINHNKLDNRRENLRVCSRSENQMNKSKRAGTTSIYKGVSLIRTNKWGVRIKFKTKDIWIGTFLDELDAGRAYNKVAKNLFGDFALLNNV